MTQPTHLTQSELATVTEYVATVHKLAQLAQNPLVLQIIPASAEQFLVDSIAIIDHVSPTLEA